MSLNIHNNNTANGDNISTPFFCNNIYTPNKYNLVFNSGEEYTLKSHQKTSLSKISPLSLAKSNNSKCSPFQLNQEDSSSNSKRNSTTNSHKISAYSRNEENKLMQSGTGNASTTQEHLSNQTDEDDIKNKKDYWKKEKKVLFENIKEQTYEYNQEQENEESSDNENDNTNDNNIVNSNYNENNHNETNSNDMDETGVQKIYKNENKNMVIQMVKALCNITKYENDKFTITKLFKLDNNYYFNDETDLNNSNIDDIQTSCSNRTANFNYPQTNRRQLDPQTVTFRDKMYSSVMKNTINFNANNNNNSNIFPVDYTFEINEAKDKTIYLMCFLTIPRIICRNELLQLMVILPLINLKQSSFMQHKRDSYFIIFKNIHTMKIIEKIDMSLITLCYINSNTSFGIQFINKSSYKKETYIIYTTNREDCYKYVEGINYFIKSN